MPKAPQTDENYSEKHKPEQKEETKPHLMWWWPVMIFILTLSAYLSMYVSGIKINEVTAYWTIGITGIGSLIAAAYHYGN